MELAVFKHIICCPWASVSSLVLRGRQIHKLLESPCFVASVVVSRRLGYGLVHRKGIARLSFGGWWMLSVLSLSVQIPASPLS